MQSTEQVEPLAHFNRRHSVALSQFKSHCAPPTQLDCQQVGTSWQLRPQLAAEHDELMHLLAGEPPVHSVSHVDPGEQRVLKFAPDSPTKVHPHVPEHCSE